MGVPIDDATLAERLHDGLSQQLFAAELDLHELRDRADLPADARAVVDRLSARLAEGSRHLREALLGVRTEAEQAYSAPLAEALAEVTATLAADCPGLAVALRVTGDGPLPPPAAGRVLMRAAREGLANVVKHAAAGSALVVLHRGARWWTVEVHDNGAGDPAALLVSMDQRRSFGLDSLRGNAEWVGGRLAVLCSPELGGILLRVAVPVHR